MNIKQQKALARFVHTIREDWDVPGIEAALGRARHDAESVHELAVVAIRAAYSGLNRTPAVIPLPGPHWRGPEATAGSSSTRPRPPAPAEACTTCGQDKRRCEQISQLAGDGHPYAPPTPAGLPPYDPETGELIEPPDPTTRLARIRAELIARQGTHEKGSPA